MNQSLPFRLSRAGWLFVACALAACIAYLPGLEELVVRWNKQEEYSHGYFIPLISGWFLWQRRQALQESMGKGVWYGLVLVGVALAMLLLGELAAIYILVQYGFLVCLIGLVLLYGGARLLKVTVLPIALLIFAVPLPYFIDSQLSWRLQLLSSNLGVEVLRLLGTSVFLEGNVIDLGLYKLQVVEACSGLRYLYPLLSIGFLMAYAYRAPLWQRAGLFLSTIPITVLMNSVRIAAVGLLVNQWGISMADGFLHYFEGWVVFIACLAFLLVEIWLFERVQQRRSLLDVLAIPDIARAPGADGAPSLRGLGLALGLVLLAAVTVYTVAKREEIYPARMSLGSFPRYLSDWRANETSMDTSTQLALGLDDYILADYRDGQGRAVNFYVAYYKSQRKGVSPHSPQVCIPGGGWLISGIEERILSMPNEPKFRITRAVIEKSGKRQLVYYWFEQRGRHIANEYWMKWYLLQDSVTRNRSDGALVRITTQVGDGEPMQNADERLIEFMRISVPHLSKHVPK